MSLEASPCNTGINRLMNCPRWAIYRPVPRHPLYKVEFSNSSGYAGKGIGHLVTWCGRRAATYGEPIRFYGVRIRPGANNLLQHTR